MKLYDYLEQYLVNPTNIKLKLYIKRQSDLVNIHNKDLFKSIIHSQPFLTVLFDDGAFSDKPTLKTRHRLWVTSIFIILASSRLLIENI